MSKMPEITYEKVATLNMISVIPDRRYKSGYRKREVVATVTSVIPQTVDGITLNLNHVAKKGKQITQNIARSRVTFTVESTEIKL